MPMALGWSHGPDDLLCARDGLVSRGRAAAPAGAYGCCACSGRLGLPGQLTPAPRPDIIWRTLASDVHAVSVSAWELKGVRCHMGTGGDIGAFDPVASPAARNGDVAGRAFEPGAVG